MNRRRIPFLTAVMIAVLTLLSMAQNARADFKIRIEDPTNPSLPPLTITDNGPGDGDPTLGSITFNVQYGSFVVASDTGISKPMVGGPARAEVDLNSFNLTSFGGGSLLITLEDTDFTVPPNALLTLQSSVGGTMSAAAGSSVTFTAYANPGNAVPFVLDTDVTTIPAGSVTLPLGTFTTANYNNSATTTFTRTPGSNYSIFGQALIQAKGNFSTVGFDHATFVTAPPCTGAIGDFVWDDQNKNGLQDAGEPGFANVTLQLFQNGGSTPISTTVTTSGGFYQFTGLCAGNYKVVVLTPPAGYTATTSQVGNDRTIDSNGSPASVTLPTDNSSDQTIDFGYFLTTPPSANCAAITAVEGVAITPVTLVGSGGTGGPYTFSATGLPAGLSISSSGTISGTPTVTGTFNYTVTVTDKDGHSGTVNCSVTVNPPPTANCVSITAVQGVAITPVTMVGSGGVGGPYTFSATGLPAGLTMSTSGTISGTPTVSGTFSYTVTVTDSGGNTGTVNCSVTVHSPPTADCVAITAVQGVAITPVTMVGSGGVGGPYTFSATGLPAGLTMSSSGTISGTPTVSGTFSYTVTVKDSAGNSGTVNCSVTVHSPPTADCVAITAVQGVAITPVTMVGSGGVGGPYTFSATGLPAGLTMSSSGTISGTPTVSGTFSYTVTVKDSAGNTGTVNCSVTVNPPPAANCVAITAVQGVAITPVTMVGSGGVGGPYTFSATGLPAGLTMSSSGTISGTPTVSGTFSYTVTVKDSAGNTGTVNCSVTVNPPPPPPVSANCVAINAVAGVAITPVTMVGSGGVGGPYTFSATGLPAGLTMSSTGTISGTPTVTGTFNYTVTITDAAGNVGTAHCSVTVNPPTGNACGLTWGYWKNHLSAWPVTSLTLGSQVYSQSELIVILGLPVAGDASINLAHQLIAAKLNVLNGTNPATAGTNITDADNLLSQFAGKLPYNVPSASAVGTQMTAVSGNLDDFNSDGLLQPGCSNNSIPPITANCVSITAVKGTPITAVTMTATGGTGTGYTFSATGLPAGLTMSATGTISGTPTVSGTFSYTVTIRDSAGNIGTVNCSVTVNTTTPPVTATCVSITAVQGVAIKPVTMTATGGTGTGYTFTATGLPNGLTMSATGTISGTPTVSGTFNYTVTVKDSAGHSGTVNCSVTVAPPSTGTTLGSGDTATIGFWHNKNGQALINSLNGGPTSTALATWLATNFPYLYGPKSSNDLTGKTNADVAALFQTFFNVKGSKTQAQILGGALASYATSTLLSGGNPPAGQYGFNISLGGTGSKTYNVGNNGTAIGLTNNQSYTVLQLLQQANLMLKNGTFDSNAFNAIFDGINSLGDIK